MLDIRLLREKPDYVKERLATRGGDFAAQVREVLSIDEQRRAAETERQKLQSDRNRISKFADAVSAGRAARLAGAMAAQDAAQPSTPVLGTPFWHHTHA